MQQSLEFNNHPSNKPSDCVTYENEKFINFQLKNSLSQTEFYNCVFENCSLLETTLVECKFENCRFINCDLSIIKIRGTIFTDIVFQNSKMIGINWTESSNTFLSVTFEECIINDSVFVGLSLQKIKIIKCIAKHADFADSNLTDADCELTDFENARFLNTNLTRTNFNNAINYSINPNLNILKRTHFSLPEAVSLLSHLDIIID